MVNSKPRPGSRPAPGNRGRAGLTPQPARPSGPPSWLQAVSLLLALAGLVVSVYETYAHFTGSRLAGCPTGRGTFNCTAVITSPQSMVFGVIPVAVLGLVFFSGWCSTPSSPRS